MLNGPFLLTLRVVSPDEFIRHWEKLYNYGSEDQYDSNIGKPLTTERVLTLFTWKNGRPLSRKKRLAIEQNVVARLPELAALPKSTSPEVFLQRFGWKGAAIWSVYLLHLWAPSKYPIYDQHVHRAMVWVQSGRPEEIPRSHSTKVREYLERYFPFWQLFSGFDQRRVDRALWACGKFMKTAVRGIRLA